MKQINTYSLYQLATQLTPLKSLPLVGAEITKDHAFTLFNALYWLNDFFIDNNALPLDLSGDAAMRLKNILEIVSNKLWNDSSEEVEDWEARNIRNHLSNLETVMSLELQRHQTYLVSQIGGYSMPLLTTKAEVNILEETRNVINEQALLDFREAGRCLAFELPTAAGFHAMRSTESVLRQYYELVFNKRTDRIEWGTCTYNLKSEGVNPKVVQILDQMRDLHRNPLMHPQDFLTMKEAIGLFDIAKSAIGALAEEIRIIEDAKSEASKSAQGTFESMLGGMVLPLNQETGFGENSSTGLSDSNE
jgi:hypothetical protein